MFVEAFFSAAEAFLADELLDLPHLLEQLTLQLFLLHRTRQVLEGDLGVLVLVDEALEVVELVRLLHHLQEVHRHPVSLDRRQLRALPRQQPLLVVLVIVPVLLTVDLRKSVL